MATKLTKSGHLLAHKLTVADNEKLLSSNLYSLSLQRGEVCKSLKPA